MENNRKPSHPAHGVISINRINGNTNLYKSDFNHQSWIALRIFRAYEVEGFGVESRVMPDHELVEVYLSEAQFARLIMSSNMACGTPCTINRFFADEELGAFGGSIPGLEREDIRQTHRGKVKEAIDDRLSKLNELRDVLVGWRNAKHRPTLAELGEIIKSFDCLHLASNFSFLQQLLEEKMEVVVSDGKTEIEAHIVQVAQKLGLEEIGGLPRLMDSKEG